MTPADLIPLCRRSLIGYAIAQWAGYRPAQHHRVIAHALERVANGTLKRLMICMPPRHGKSMLASEYFPAFYFGHHADHQILHCSYSQELADGFGRKVRNQLRDELYGAVFPGTVLSEDSQAANKFNTSGQGSYFATGVGGSLTGRGAHLLLIDDPVKDREDADSERMRTTLKDWYTSVAYTRLMPGGAVVVIQCMTGDTPVTMADGTAKPLRDIRPGDEVATFKDGRVSRSVVTNWASQGVDSVYAITTASGARVRANGRHPFLISQAGSLKWVKTKDLCLGQEMLRASGASGKARLARQKDALWPSEAGAIASPTTTRSAGLKVFGHHLATGTPGAKRTSSTGTGSRRPTTIVSWLSRIASAPSAGVLQAAMCAPIGAASCASITATTPAKFERFCATTATLWSATQRLLRRLTQRPSTFDFTLDPIVEITPAGAEEVFDIQVAGTENFIANGLVSHNTRWHEDDLMGWLLQDHAHEGWEVINLPAWDDNDNPTTALWPESYPISRLAQIRATLPPRDWEALYMQRPRAGIGAAFKRGWLQFYDGPVNSKAMYRIMLVDPATSQVDRKNNDFTAMWVVGLGEDENYYVLDMVRDRLNLTERTEAVFRLHRKWKPGQVRYERYGMMADVEHLRNEMNRRSYRFSLTEVGGATKKEDRIKRLVPLFQQGRVWLPHEMKYTNMAGAVRDLVHDFIEEEYLAFPVGRHDDMLDGLSRVVEPSLDSPWPSKRQNLGPVISFGVLDASVGY